MNYWSDRMQRISTIESNSYATLFLFGVWLAAIQNHGLQRSDIEKSLHMEYLVAVKTEIRFHCNEFGDLYFCIFEYRISQWFVWNITHIFHIQNWFSQHFRNNFGPPISFFLSFSLPCCGWFNVYTNPDSLIYAHNAVEQHIVSGHS